MRALRLFFNRHRGVTAAVVLGVLVVGALLAVSANLPTEKPARSTADVFAELDQHRAIREDVQPEPTAPSVHAQLAPTATPVAVYDAPVTRFRVEKIGVDAPVSQKNLLRDGTMESPSGPTDVAWYDFTAKPGQNGNAVFSGHLDYIRYGPAVFYNLRKLVAGDTIEVVLADNTVLTYAVTASQSYPVALMPMQEVLATTAEDTLTVITCGGAFAGSQYSDRLVVRAVRTGVTPGTH